MRYTGVNGKLLCAEGGGGSVLNARTDPGGTGGWEEFSEIVVPNGTVALQSENGMYISAQPNGTIEVNRTVLGPWEQWTKVPAENGFAFLSHHGLFMCTDLGLPVSSGSEWSGHRVVADRGGLGPWEVFTTAFIGTPRLRIRQDYFELETGDRFTAVECTDFRLFKRFLESENIDGVLQDRKNLGFNMLRVIGMAYNMFDFRPQNYSNYYAALHMFAQKLAQYGLYLEFTCFADATVIMPSLTDQLRHWQLVGDALRGQPNAIIELVNENDQIINHMNTAAFNPLNDIVCSHGSNGSQAVPVRPWWNYETFHTNDAFEWWRKGGHNGMELAHGTEGLEASHVPILVNENTRPDRDGNLNHHEDAAAAAALLVAGSCFHSNDGKESRVFSGQDRDAAIVHARGAKSVDLGAQGRPYRRRDDLLTPDMLRVYQRGFDDSHIVRIRR